MMPLEEARRLSRLYLVSEPQEGVPCLSSVFPGVQWLMLEDEGEKILESLKSESSCAHDGPFEIFRALDYNSQHRFLRGEMFSSSDLVALKSTRYVSDGEDYDDDED